MRVRYEVGELCVHVFEMGRGFLGGLVLGLAVWIKGYKGCKQLLK